MESQRNFHKKKKNKMKKKNREEKWIENGQVNGHTAQHTAHRAIKMFEVRKMFCKSIVFMKVNKKPIYRVLYT